MALYVILTCLWRAEVWAPRLIEEASNARRDVPTRVFHWALVVAVAVNDEE
jgi:hypothetical protein